MARKFAVFDIDGTLIRWQLYHAIVDELLKQGKIPASVGKSINDARQIWKRRAHSGSYEDYEHVLWQAYTTSVKQVSVSDVETAVDKVFETYKEQTYAYTRDLIASLKSDGYLLFAVSGSHQEIVQKLGDFYGFDDVVGTEYVQHDEQFTGEEISPVGQKDKILQQLVAKHDCTWEGSLAVGDSTSDIPMLKLVEKPIAFNPNRVLLEAAKAKGWDVVIERKNVIYMLEHRNGSYILA